MSKRKLETMLEDDRSETASVIKDNVRKHTLDSDEEDNVDDQYDIMNENDIEGEEDGEMFKEGEVHITPFNMKEELQEGHFDTQGHYHWKKEEQDEVKDHWLDNIDWVKVRDETSGKPKPADDDLMKGLGDESESDEDTTFDLKYTYKNILDYMKPKETIAKALRRLGGNNAKISSAERWKRRKAGIVDENAEHITKLTSLANDILTNTGNMDIYEETYETIFSQVNPTDKKASTSSAGLDMYSDDFDTKERDTKADTEVSFAEPEVPNKPDLMWEFKWSQTDTDEVHGPHTTEQMQSWVIDGYFKTGVWVRKVGEGDRQFYTSNRIDFELYL